jgi:WD40 repeat protein
MIGQNGMERIVQVFDTRTGEVLQTTRQDLRKHGRDIGMAFSADGKFGANADGCIIDVWDAQTGKSLVSHEGHTSSIQELAFRDSGREIVTNAEDGRAIVWDASTGKQLREFTHGDRSWYPRHLIGGHGRLLVTRAKDGLRFWNLADGTSRFQALLVDGVAVRDVALGGKTVVLGTEGGAVLLDVASGKQREPIKVFRPQGHLALSPDERRLAEFWDDHLAVWDVETAKILWQYKEDYTAHQVSPEVLCWTPDSRQLLVELEHRYMGERTVFLDAATGEVRGKLNFWGRVASAAFSADGRCLATVSSQGGVRLWETTTRQLIGSFIPQRPTGDGQGRKYEQLRLAFDPAGLRLAVAGDDTTALVYSLPLLFADKTSPPFDEKTWSVLIGDNSQASFRLMMTLTRHPAGAVGFLRKRIAPVAGATDKRIQELIAELDAAGYARRQAASDELVRVGDAATQPLQERLKTAQSIEAKRRTEWVLDAIGKQSTVPQERVLQVLEAIGTSEAREVLSALAKGHPRAQLTQQARRALERLRSARGDRS